MVILVDARAKRNVARALLAEGRDPMVMKKLKIEANLEAGRNTFERVARQWHEMAKPQWAAIHASDVLRSLERDIFPEIGEIPIADLTPPIIYDRSEEHTSELQSLMRISYAVFCLQKKNKQNT